MTSMLMTEPDYLIRCRSQATGWTNEEVDLSTTAGTDSGAHPGCWWLFPQGVRGVKLTHFCLVPKMNSFTLWYLIKHGSKFTCVIIALPSDFVKFHAVITELACRHTDMVTALLCVPYIGARRTTSHSF